MRPLSRARCAWWDSFVSALVVLGVLVAIGAVMVLAEWLGTALIRPALTVAALLIALVGPEPAGRRRLRARGRVVRSWVARSPAFLRPTQEPRHERARRPRHPFP